MARRPQGKRKASAQMFLETRSSTVPSRDCDGSSFPVAFDAGQKGSPGSPTQSQPTVPTDHIPVVLKPPHGR